MERILLLRDVGWRGRNRHAFAHEQNRDDTPDWCNDQKGSKGDLQIGPWDEDSVMNYCNADWNNDGELSSIDVAGVRTVYGINGPRPFRPLACGRLFAGEGLRAGASHRSCDGRFELSMQLDGNLVVYEDGDQPLWSSQTNGTHAQRVVMQSDGNLVIYGADGQPYWASRTYGHDGAFADLQDDGNFVVYERDGTALWYTGTSGR